MPRLPKAYKTELNKAEQERRDAVKLRNRLFPLRFNPLQKESIPSASKQKFLGRISVLVDIYGYLYSLAIREFDNIEWGWGMAWSTYSALHMDEGFGVAADPQIFRELVALDGGMPSLLDLQTTQSYWFFKNYQYRFDCSVMMAKLIINMNWARVNGGSQFVSANLHQFPVVDMILGDGPIYPDIKATFGREDEHFIIWEEDQLWLIPFGDRVVEERIPVEVIHR